MEKTRSIKTLPLDGGVLPFHFINTVYAWRGENLKEYLNNYEEFLEWCRKVAVLDEAVLNQLEQEANLHPRKAASDFQQILQARQLFYNFFSGVAASRPSQRCVDDFNALIQQALDHFEWIQVGEGPTFQIKKDIIDLLLPLWSIVYAAHQLLLGGNHDRIKECSRCGWIFLDETKNKKRRWCNPNSCGSTDKMHRYYQKKKARANG